MAVSQKNKDKARKVLVEKAKIMEKSKEVDTMTIAVEVKQNEEVVVGTVNKPESKTDENETGGKKEAVEMAGNPEKGR